MPNIKLPDGNNLNFKSKITGLQIADKISKSLFKQALVISIDGSLKDLNYEIDKDCSVKIYTSKDKEGLETIRHDTAHIFELDETTLKSMGIEGRKNVIKKFNVEKMCFSTYSEYKKLIK